jgi:hypothetical protein
MIDRKFIGFSQEKTRKKKKHLFSRWNTVPLNPTLRPFK